MAKKQADAKSLMSKNSQEDEVGGGFDFDIKTVKINPPLL